MGPGKCVARDASVIEATLLEEGCKTDDLGRWRADRSGEQGQISVERGNRVLVSELRHHDANSIERISSRGFEHGASARPSEASCADGKHQKVRDSERDDLERAVH